MSKKETYLKNAISLSAYLLVVWGFYRFLFELPESIEEVFIKPIVWLVPVFIYMLREKRGLSSLGLTIKNIFPAVYFALALGVFFVVEAILLNYAKYGGLNFNPNIETAFGVGVAISLVTAFVEEVTFRGFLFGRVLESTKNEVFANLSTSLIWGLVHVPVTLFVWELDTLSVFGYFFLVMIFGIGSAFVYARTKNIFSSILLHLLWSWPIILFR